jgi:hypothetical protein
LSGSTSRVSPGALNRLSKSVASTSSATPALLDRSAILKGYASTSGMGWAFAPDGAYAFASASCAEGAFRGLGFLRTLMAEASSIFLMWAA